MSSPLSVATTCTGCLGRRSDSRSSTSSGCQTEKNRLTRVYSAGAGKNSVGGHSGQSFIDDVFVRLAATERRRIADDRVPVGGLHEYQRAHWSLWLCGSSDVKRTIKSCDGPGVPDNPHRLCRRSKLGDVWRRRRHDRFTRFALDEGCERVAPRALPLRHRSASTPASTYSIWRGACTLTIASPYRMVATTLGRDSYPRRRVSRGRPGLNQVRQSRPLLRPNLARRFRCGRTRKLDHHLGRRHVTSRTILPSEPLNRFCSHERYPRTGGMPDGSRPEVSRCCQGHVRHWAAVMGLGLTSRCHRMDATGLM